MQPYRCGCQRHEFGLQYCREHAAMECHALGPNTDPGECPDCRRARWGSVSMDLALSTLEKARTRPGIPPHVRLAEKDEFDPDLRLTQHSKVREKRETL